VIVRRVHQLADHIEEINSRRSIDDQQEIHPHNQLFGENEIHLAYRANTYSKWFTKLLILFFLEKLWFVSFWIIDFMVDDVPKDAKLWYKRSEIVGKQTIKEMEENSICKKMSSNHLSDSIYNSSYQIKMPVVNTKEFPINHIINKNKYIPDSE
jgi:hypothetical protein